MAGGSSRRGPRLGDSASLCDFRSPPPFTPPPFPIGRSGRRRWRVVRVRLGHRPSGNRGAGGISRPRPAGAKRRRLSCASACSPTAWAAGCRSWAAGCCLASSSSSSAARLSACSASSPWQVRPVPLDALAPHCHEFVLHFMCNSDSGLMLRAWHAAYTNLQVDIDRIRADNEARTDAQRKNGLIIWSGGLARLLPARLGGTVCVASIRGAPSAIVPSPTLGPAWLHCTGAGG